MIVALFCKLIIGKLPFAINCFYLFIVYRDLNIILNCHRLHHIKIVLRLHLTVIYDRELSIECAWTIVSVIICEGNWNLNPKSEVCIVSVFYAGMDDGGRFGLSDLW